MNRTYMLDIGICALILREHPAALLKPLEQAVLDGDRIVVPAITWAKISLAARVSGPAAQQLADAFAARLDAILHWDRAAADATTEIKVALRLAPIGPNDTAIAGHANAAGAVRVSGLKLEDWAN